MNKIIIFVTVAMMGVSADHHAQIPSTQSGLFSSQFPQYTPGRKSASNNNPSESSLPNNMSDEKESEIRILPLPIPVYLPGTAGILQPRPYAGFPSQLPHHPGLGPTFPSFNGPSTGFGHPIVSSILASRSNPYIHLLAAPYLKNVQKNGGKDLPTIEEFQNLLEKSSFGLSQF